jgi:hypothetical protein
MSTQTPGDGQRPKRSRLLAPGWREHLAVRLLELKTRTAPLAESDVKTLANALLDRASRAVEHGPTIGGAWSGADVERAWVSTHAAEVALVRAASPEDVTAGLPSLVEACAAVIPKDPRIATLKKIVDAGRAVTASEQRLAADTLASAQATSEAQHVRVRSFRNLLLGTTGALSGFAVLIAMVATWAPGAFAVCDSVAKSAVASCPTGSRHPTGGDVFVVEVLGLFAAAITGAVAIRKLRGTSTPYAVPLASIVLKLPIGALTALGGLMLLRAGFGPSLTALNQAQVSAYALVFGASQQLFMQFVDKQAKSVLDATTTPGDVSGGTSSN